MKIKIIHDNISLIGGAEKLILALLDLKNSDLFVNHINKKSLIFKKKHLKKIQYLTDSKRILNFLNYLKKQKYLTCKNVTYFISGNFSILYVFKIHKNNKKIFYCHHLPKFAFEITNYQSIKKLQIFFLFPLILVYKILYKFALKKFDLILVNSFFTQEKLKRIGFESKVVYPPIEIPKIQKKMKNRKKYFLSFGRLEKYKNVDKIINAFSKRQDKSTYLYIVSGGSMYSSYKQKTKNFKNIKLYDWVSNKKLNNLIFNSIATIYVPKNEDFGMTAAESLAHGVPVIGCNSGGLKEFLNTKNSYLIDEVNEKNINKGIDFFIKNYKKFKYSNLIKSVSKFKKEVFIKKIKFYIKIK